MRKKIKEEWLASEHIRNLNFYLNAVMIGAFAIIQLLSLDAPLRIYQNIYGYEFNQC